MSDRTRPTVEQRFWAKVIKTETCWLWSASCGHGYGRFSVNRKSVIAHRFAYELLVGPIPDGLVLDHLCRVTRCVNPTHLEPVTTRENTMRGALPAIASLQNIDKTHCKYGHPLFGENLYVPPAHPTYRRCRQCARDRVQKYEASGKRPPDKRRKRLP